MVNRREIIASVKADQLAAWTTYAAERTAVLAGTESEEQLQLLALVLYALHAVPTLAPPWAGLAAQLRKHPRIGSSARRTLESVPRAELLGLLEQHPIAVPVVAPVPVPEPRDWLVRYERGEHAVWDEILTHAAAIAQHPELRAEACAVAAALMARVRANTDAIRATLIASGARIADEAAPADASDFAGLEARFGPLPVAIEAFYRVVGSIDLCPHGSDSYQYGSTTLERDGITLLHLDPVVVDPLDFVGPRLEDYEALCAETHPDVVGPFAFDFAPDFLHKANISGGAPYSFELPAVTPTDAIDPWLGWQTFVGYLRYAFRSGGFPLLSVATRPLDEISLNHRIAFEHVEGSWADAASRLVAKLRVNVVDF